MTQVTLYPGDNRETLRRLIKEGVQVHSVVTDPPYGLVSIQKRFGKDGSKAARTEKNDGSFARLSGGFMGRKWDATGIERDPEFWELIYDILLPGGYVFAFSGSRTGHWQAVAMELAGFIMHPMHGWVFGSGFPKAHAADKAIDKLLGIDGGFVPQGAAVKRMIPGADQHATGSWIKDGAREYQPGQYVPGSLEAAEWEGWAYGTQAQKPALEPIYLGQKPFSEKTGAANLLKHGVGAVNIDGCRVPSTEILNGGAYSGSKRSGNWQNEDRKHGKGSGFENGGAGEFIQPNGRHPANLMHDGSDEVLALFPASAGAAAPVKGTEPSAAIKNAYNARERVEGAFHDDSGSAARFFHAFQADTDPIIYNSKAGKFDRGGGDHPTVKPIKLMRYLIRHITPPGGVVLDPFAGSGTTGVAADLEGFSSILMEAEPDYVTFLQKRFGFYDPGFDELLGLEENSTKCGFEDLGL